MQYVRCEACGAKALLAASRCPKCTKSLELRDHYGEFVPLSHCHKCDTYYPTSRGGCKWCGTTPDSSGPIRRKAILGVVALAAAAWAVLRFRSPGTTTTPEPAVALKPSPAAVPPGTAVIPSVTVSTAPGALTDSAVADTATRDTMAVANTAEPPTPPVETRETARPVTPVAPPPAGAFARTGYATTDTWINLRDGADRTAAIVGTLSPGTRVETGARLRGWRQVRANGVVGWVDPRHLVEAPPPAR